ncbi:hypothetical protein [Streptomyces sp. NRRL S-1868]|uniref:hypothetical protein n=1 Tax=Streptomyces sp. NRRL S-1868 TaxID=1463892 RepID=UPI0006897E64|nr:hypothetical protein [Streptomyces sp. NRRL S-1868]
MSEHSLNLHSNKKPNKREKKHDSRLPPLDWAAGHGPVTGPLSATTGCAATALLGAATGMPEGWPLAVSAAGALGHGIGVSIRRKLTGRSITTRAASWLLAGGWTTWAMATGPLSWTAAGSLAALGVGIGAMASNARVHEEAAEEERLSAEAREIAREMNAEREALAREWSERIARVCHINVSVFAVEMWQTGAGFSLAAELPAGGATWDQIAKSARALATDARLPLGCAIGVEEGDKQGRVVLDVPTRNVMADDVDYPEDYSALSILTGIPWALLPHSGTVNVFLREACAIILGPPGSGKSTFLDAVLAGFARCTDVLTWVIDFNAGGVGHGWVRPWLEAQKCLKPEDSTPRPPAETRPGVDWLASTPQEAARMLQAALAINAARKRHYQRLMAREDTTLLPVSSEIPQIMIVVDEGAELLSHTGLGNKTLKQVQEDLKEVIRTNRAMGIRVVLTAVDGNVSAIGSTEVRKFSPVAAALTSAETAETNVAKLFGRISVDTSQLTAKGTGVIRAATADGFPATAFKGWKTSPSMVRRAVLNTSHLHPVLDEPSRAAAGTDYTERWSPERAGWLWENDQPTDTQTPAPAPAPEAPAPRSHSGGLNLRALRDQPQDNPEDELISRFREQLDALDSPEALDAPEETSPPPRDQHTERPGLNLRALREDNQDAGPATDEMHTDARTAALQLVLAAGPDGTGASALERQLRPRFGTTRPTIHGWLQEWVDSGDVVRVGSGSKTRYVHHEHADKH